MTTQTVSATASVVHLPEILDLKAAGPLREEILAAKGRPIEIDASHVQRLGGLCLQVLLSAQRTWTTEGMALSVVEPSTDFLEGLTLFGAAALTAKSSGASL